MLRARGRRGRRTYLIGVAGHPNFGDEAITRGWLRWLAKHRPRDEVWLDVPNPAGAAALLHGEHPHLVVVDTVHRLGLDADPTSAGSVVAHVDQVLTEPWRAPRWLAGIEALRSADVVHLVGGGFVNAQRPHPASVLAAMSWMGEHTPARLAISGAGLTPGFTELPELYATLGPRLEVATVRDPESALLLPTAEVGADDVWLGGVEQHLDQRAGTADVMVIAQGDGHDRLDELASTVGDLLDAWGVGADDFAVVEANPPVDGHVRAALEERFGDHRFHSFGEVVTHGLPARRGQRWITTRYHPHLLAAAVGASGVAISVSDGYYDVKHRAVTAAGSGWPVIGIGDAPVDAGDAGDLPGRAGEHAAGLARLAARIHA
ncbi:polysaccharide pyruvyl transferase family protein [Aeromicrobium sp. Sec7.5]|uniref:polysaccharide pyruvyl transferase family protein n=1 Tax=Aeromicrobium sp. Sec7.5 TaxID=3121276 RepID=UPI002FE432A1